jgi:hypothetical protein
MTTQAPGGQPMTAEQTESVGLLAFLNNSGPLATAARSTADEARNFDSLADDLPLDSTVRGHVANAARIAASAADITDELYAAGRRHHETDYGRAETPRGGDTTTEMKADAGKSHDDGAV